MAGLSGMSLSPDGQRDAAPQGNGSVLKMFYGIEKGLEALAAAVPDEAGKLDSIKSSLREVLNSVLSGGPQQDNGPNLLKGGAESY
jgi:hypothetical protein